MKKLMFIALCLIASTATFGVNCSIAHDRDDFIYTTENEDEFAVKDSIKPRFNGQTEEGQRVSLEHILKKGNSNPLLALVEINGKAKIRATTAEDVVYIDPLAVKHGSLGEHPREKILRLHNDFGIPIKKRLYKKIVGSEFDDSIFHSVVFEYLPGKRMSGIVSEIFPDGTLLVIPNEIPVEWQSDDPDKPPPTHFRLDPRAFLMSGSIIGEEYKAYEEEILSLSYEEQRSPPVDIAARECNFYYKSLNSKESRVYHGILHDIGFDTDIFWDPQLFENSDESMLVAMNSAYYGPGVRYFGFSSRWMASQMRKLGFDNIVDPCDELSRLSRDGDIFHFVITRDLEPAKDKRNIFMKAEKGGMASALHVAPGYILMLQQHPTNTGLFFMSVEGWPDASSEGADPRWQSVYLVDMTNPDKYKIIRYPPPNSIDAPEAKGHLYGHSEFISEDGKFFYALLYGFEEEGGGLWVIDLQKENFHENKDAFAQIFSWDHALTFLLFPRPDQSPHHTAIMTGKEVNDNFAMTLNALKIKFDGLESELIEKERLIKMIGWNPVPFAYQWMSEEEVNILVQTYFNYESSLVPRVWGVYIVPVSLR